MKIERIRIADSDYFMHVLRSLIVAADAGLEFKQILLWVDATLRAHLAATLRMAVLTRKLLFNHSVFPFEHVSHENIRAKPSGSWCTITASFSGRNI